MEVCKLLVECQADVNAKDQECDARPLHMLLKTKAVLRFCFERCNSHLLFSGKTALHLSYGHMEVCKLLIEYQADVNAKDDYQCDARPLHMLLQTKAVLRFCFERCNSCLLFSGKTALHMSYGHMPMEVCKLLVECQADVNAKDGLCDARPLHMLLQTKAVLRFCFERCNSCLLFSGKTALHWSCEWGNNVEVCKLLVECQADVNAKDGLCDARPLHMLFQTKAGLRFCFERCNSCLLFSGKTALHFSSALGHTEVCKLLVEAQADMNAKNDEFDGGG